VIVSSSELSKVRVFFWITDIVSEFSSFVLLKFSTDKRAAASVVLFISGINIYIRVWPVYSELVWCYLNSEISALCIVLIYPALVQFCTDKFLIRTKIRPNSTRMHRNNINDCCLIYKSKGTNYNGTACLPAAVVDWILAVSTVPPACLQMQSTGYLLLVLCHLPACSCNRLDTCC